MSKQDEPPEDDHPDDDEGPNFSNDPCLLGVSTSMVASGRCPHCQVVNYVPLGDMEDCTAPDVEVVECWKCKKKSWLNSEVRDLGPDLGHESIEDAYSEHGRRVP